MMASVTGRDMTTTHPLTWNQWRDAEARQTAEENGCTLAEAAECADFRRSEWWSGVEAFVCGGGQLSARFLNTLSDPYAFRLLWIAAQNAGNPAPFPPGYVLPHRRAS